MIRVDVSYLCIGQSIFKSPQNLDHPSHFVTWSVNGSDACNSISRTLGTILFFLISRLFCLSLKVGLGEQEKGTAILVSLKDKTGSEKYCG